ncbi:MAG: cell division protein ZapA [Acidobacteria bacterium]|nr:cell division protein ZapA [Acidobacteriota bacterium]
MSQVDAGSSDKNVVRVIIFQQPYTLRSSGGQGEAEALAHAVDDLMNQIAAKTSGADPTRVAVLACLHLADKIRHVEKEQAEQRARIESLDSRLAETLKLD